jgi:hypothetical protein
MIQPYPSRAADPMGWTPSHVDREGKLFCTLTLLGLSHLRFERGRPRVFRKI